MADGLLGKCRDCTKRDVAEHRTANRDQVRAYERRRARTPKRKALSYRVVKEWRKKKRQQLLAANS
jgi:hypothetical protein